MAQWKEAREVFPIYLALAKQLSLSVAILMESQRAELVEEREGQLLDVEGVRLIEPKCAAQAQDAAQPHRLPLLV